MKHEHNLECKDLLGNLSEFIDGELDAETCQKLKEHMAGCEDCRVVYDTTTRTIYLCQTSINEGELPPDVRSRLFKTLQLDDLLPRGDGWRSAVRAVRRGEACPSCGAGTLDYNGLLDLECPACGYSEGAGAGCT